MACAYTQVVDRSIGIGQQKEVHALALGELFAQRSPASALRIPVVFVEVRADPEVCASRFIGLEIGQGPFEHTGNVCVGRAGCRTGQVHQGLGTVQGLYALAGTVNEYQLAAHLVFFQELGQLGQGRAALGLAGLHVQRLHAGRAVQQDEGRVGLAHTHSAQPATDQRTADSKDQGSNGRHAHQHDQHIAQAGHAPAHALGLDQEHHGRPGHGAVPMLMDQMDHNGQGHQGKGQ